MRRRLLTLVLAVLALPMVLGSVSRAQETPITVTDIAGRTVQLPGPVKRVVLGEGRQLLAMSLIHPDPASLVAGWPTDLIRQDPTTYGRYKARFPAIEKLPAIGRGSADTFSVEQALAVAPDVAILSGGYGPSVKSTNIVSHFAAAGIPVVFIDFIAKPIENTVPSMRILGKVLGRSAAAEAYIEFYTRRIERIRTGLAEAKPKSPKVFMHAHAGLGGCCNSPSRATIGAFIDPAGGSNIAADVIKQPFGQLNLEYVLSADPDVYVGTGGVHLIGKGGLVLGPGIDATTAVKSLEQVVSNPGLAALRAVQSKNAYGLWHIFNNLPMNVLAIEVLAKWFHPDLFADVDPEESLKIINERFLPVPMEGTYWIALP